MHTHCKPERKYAHIIMDNTAMVLELAIILCAKGLYVGPWGVEALDVV